MTSQKQIRANKENAQKSSGPNDTDKTKRNATKFGIFSKEMVLNGFYGVENKKELILLVEQVYEEYEPQTITQQVLTEKIIDCIWRLKRIRTAETAAIKKEIDVAEDDVRESIFLRDMENYVLACHSKEFIDIQKTPEPILKARVKELKKEISTIEDVRELEEKKETLNVFIRLLEAKEREIENLVLLKEKESLIPKEIERLASYETTIERQLYRAITALRRLKGWD